MTVSMKNLALVIALFGAFVLVGCNAGGEPGDPMKGANTGAQPSSVGNLPTPSKAPTTNPNSQGNSLSR